MYSSLSDRAVLITGASSGIGLDTATFLACGTPALVHAGVRKQKDFDAIAALGIRNLQPILLDVTSDDSVRSAIAKIESETAHPLFALVNNAGSALAGPLEFLPISEIEEQFEVNVYGLLRVTQACIPSLRRTRGRIINLGSISGKVTSPFIAAYAASKHAVEALSDGLRRELSPWNIEVSLIEPGMVQTPIWETSKDRALRLIEQIPVAGRDLYAARMQDLLGGIERSLKFASKSDAVYRVILDALVHPHPQTRYLVGKDAKIASALKILPDRWFDKILVHARYGRD